MKRHLQWGGGQTLFCAHIGEDTWNWAVPRKGECSSTELSVNLAMSDLAPQWTKIPSSLGGQRWQRSCGLSGWEPVSASQKAGQKGRVQGTGPGRLWWETGCGRRWACWCPALQQGAAEPEDNPRGAWGPGAAMRNGGRRRSLVDSQPRPCPLPGLCRWAAAGLREELSPAVLEVRVPEVRVPVDY